MNPSKYLTAFKRLKESGLAFDIPGDGMLVEKIPDEEVKSASGLYIPKVSGYKGEGIAANLPIFVHVLSPGKGYYDDDTGADVPLSVDAGDIILVGQSSVRWFGSLDIQGYEPFTIGVTREAEAQIRFKGIEDYRRVFGILNQATEAKVDQ